MDDTQGRGRVALVTGGASGIGLATATVLAGRGWRVVVADRTGADAAAAGIGAAAVTFDVTDEAATAEAFRGVEARVGPIEAVMANAGLIQPGGRPEDRPLQEFDAIVGVNLRGVYVTCLAAGRLMAPRGRGGIVVTGSVTASRPIPSSAYAATKAAVVHLAACLAGEWGRSGVRVNAVSPGYVATPPIQAAIANGLRDQGAIEDAAALGRMVDAAEIGRAVAFLLSDDASAITGINLPVDAGWLAGAHLGMYGGVRAAYPGMRATPVAMDGLPRLGG